MMRVGNPATCDALTWPDIPAPSWVDEDLRRKLCLVAGGGTRARSDGPFHWAEGDATAPLGIILDNPGARQDAQGRSQVCGTRRTLQGALIEAGVEPASVFVTYLFKVRPRRAYDRDEAVRISLPVLRRQVLEGRERRWLALGDRVVGALFWPGDFSESGPGLRNEVSPGMQSEVGTESAVVQGAKPTVRASRCKLLEWCGQSVVTSYHPLAARRRPNLFPLLVQDVARVVRVSVGDSSGPR